MSKRARRTRGDGGLYQTADGLWRGVVDLGWTEQGTRRRRYVSHRTQAGALEKLRALRREVELTGDAPTSSGVTLAAWLERWLVEVQAPRVRPRSLDENRATVRLYIVPAIGRVRVDRLTPAHVARLRDYIVRERGLSSTTALKAHRTLSKALNDAQRWGLTSRNVATLIDAPRRAVSRRTALTAEQARELLRAADDDPFAARWALALVYGVRQGEALGLRWEAVDLEAGTIDLAWQLQRLTFRHGCGAKAEGSWPCGRKRAGACPSRGFEWPSGFEVEQLDGARCLTRPKTRGSQRIVPIVPMIAAALEHRRAISAGLPNPHGLVFANPDGSPVWPNLDSAAWHARLEAAKLPSVPLHSARHTAATLLLELGVDAATIAAILGHSDVVTTRSYQHVDLALAARALETLTAALEAPKDSREIVV